MAITKKDKFETKILELETKILELEEIQKNSVRIVAKVVDILQNKLQIDTEIINAIK